MSLRCVSVQNGIGFVVGSLGFVVKSNEFCAVMAKIKLTVCRIMD